MAEENIRMVERSKNQQSQSRFENYVEEMCIRAVRLQALRLLIKLVI